MSKSLGNGVDPLDIIHSHGADAMRFTLAAMTTHTQDLRMPVDLVDPHSGEAFPPAKITNSAAATSWRRRSRPARRTRTRRWSRATAWPAGRPSRRRRCRWRKTPAASSTSGGTSATRSGTPAGSRCRTLQGVAPEPVDEQKWSLADRWIVSRLNRTIEEANAALARVSLRRLRQGVLRLLLARPVRLVRGGDQAGDEGSRPAPARPPTCLAAVLDGALRLMHPMIPFITETIWWRLNEVRPSRDLPGHVLLPPSHRLVLAQWPRPGENAQCHGNIWKDPGNRQRAAQPSQ